jgi:3',5'-cyclic AMP phosphodiesterase CpdA
VSTIAHLSDLHFGTEVGALIEPLLEDVAAQQPALVVVSGDLTQRARARQFEAARSFLARISAPVLVVPGNHDVPLYDVARRVLFPLARYRHYITDDLMPTFLDADVAVLGLNTARSNTWKSGRLSHDQVDAIPRFFSPVPEHACRILVTHHPFIPTPHDPASKVVGRGLQALQAAEAMQVDVLLAGHLHVAYSGDARSHYLRITRSMLAVQAGTALSSRTRGEINAYNVIRVQLPRLSLDVRAWNGAAFDTVRTEQFDRQGKDWVRVAP